MAHVAPRFSPSDSIILLVDHQTMTIDWVKSLPKTTVIASCRVLARMGVTFSIPLFLTTTMEEYVGPTLPEIQEVAPDSFRGAVQARRHPKLLRPTGARCRTQGYWPHQPHPGRTYHGHMFILGRTGCSASRL